MAAVKFDSADVGMERIALTGALADMEISGNTEFGSRGMEMRQEIGTDRAPEANKLEITPGKTERRLPEFDRVMDE